MIINKTVGQDDLIFIKSGKDINVILRERNIDILNFKHELDKEEFNKEVDKYCDYFYKAWY